MNGSGRPLVWLGSTRRDVRAFPRSVRREIGVALYTAQQAETDPAAKPMKGFAGASVIEIISDFQGDTWRAVYTVRFREAVYVLHAFPEKVQTWDRHAEAGARSDQAPPGGGRAFSPRKAELAWRQKRKPSSGEKPAAAMCSPISASLIPSRNCSRPSSPWKSTGSSPTPP